MKNGRAIYADIRSPLHIIKICKPYGLNIKVRQKKRKGANQIDVAIQKLHMSCDRWKFL